MDSVDRSVQSGAMAGAKTATGTASQYGNTAGGIGANLIPGLTQQFNNPQGLSPTDVNNEWVAAQQAGGGATGAVQGEAGLNAERTRNSAGLSSVLDQAARRQGQNLSQSALGIQNQNAMLKQKQREQAGQELGSLYGTDVGAQLKAMGISNEDLDTALKAGPSGWLQQGMGIGQGLFGKGGMFAPGGAFGQNQSQG